MTGVLTIYCDSREQRVPPFPAGVVVERVTMSEGDYTTEALQGIAVIERKSAADFASSITRGRERFDDELRRLRPYRWKVIVVEGAIQDCYRASAVHPNALIGSVASFLATHDVPSLFVACPSDAGRLIAGILSRWQRRIAAEIASQDERPTVKP